MQLLGSFGNRNPLYIVFSIMVFVLAACSLQLIIVPPIADQPSTSTPTLVPVSTTVFAFLPTFVAPEYLEVEPIEIDPFPELESCDRRWVKDEVLAEARPGAREISIDCHLTLDRNDVVTKRMIFETSGVTLECNGAKITGGDGTPGNLQNINYNRDMIEVRSPSRIIGRERVWERPRRITIKGCDIIGSVRVWGMATNGEGTNPLVDDGINHLRNSARMEGHTERVRANAPTEIVFDNITVTGVGRNPVYFAPGVTFSKLINSEIKGKSDAVALYLDAESYANTIKNNKIHVTTKNYIFERWDRPLIAIDGSSHNKIFNNWFSNLNHGGIYLYRNCGEGGVVRHATPSYNQIINNVFYYNEYDGSNPSVYLGSRDYGWFEETFGHCEDDSVPNTISEVPFGSGISSKDYATHNVVMQNQIFKRSVTDMIKTQNTDVNSPNYISHNRTVTEGTVIRNGLAGCYVAAGYKDFVSHGGLIDVYRGSNNVPVCTDYQDICSDGDLIRVRNSECQLTTEEFDCRVTGSNAGCNQTVICPVGQRIIAASAACNLEWGIISDAVLADVPGNIIRVLRASDGVSSGLCSIGTYELREDELAIDGLVDSYGVSVACDEYDVNGGDCQIRGVLYCR